MKRVLISRTDNIGDVVLTLPMAGLIKKHYPNVEVLFLGSKYTKPIVDCCEHIDSWHEWNPANTNLLKDLDCDVIIHVYPNSQIAKAAKDAKIPLRIGTSHRFYNWLYCNHKVSLSRKNSALHEAQLNIKLLAPLHINTQIDVAELPKLYGFTKVQNLSQKYLDLLEKNKFNLVLHPKSKGSAQEWDAENFVALANSLDSERFKIFISGSKEEKEFIVNNILPHTNNLTDISGLFPLSEFISFLKECDGLVAASTGPLHIAAALGKHVLGLYPDIKTMLPRRWGPLGSQAQSLIGKVNINNISPCLVKDIVEKWPQL